MPRFSLRTVFIAVTTIAFICGGIFFLQQFRVRGMVRHVWAPPPSVHNLNRVQRGMHEDDIYDVIGVPDFQWGSGIRVDVYELPDGYQFCIRYVDSRACWIRHVDPSNRYAPNN